MQLNFSVRPQKEIPLKLLLLNFVAWIIFPLLLFAVAFPLTPFITLGNPFFELLVDTFEMLPYVNDAISRITFGIVFLYLHMLLPTAIYYFKRNKKKFNITIVIWLFISMSTAINSLSVYLFHYNLGKS
jgi:hypothetical protein